MFTSRVEYRLIVREDNADKRLAHMVISLGFYLNRIITGSWKNMRLLRMRLSIYASTRIPPGTPLDKVLENAQSAPLKQSISLYDLLKRPEINYDMIAGFDGTLKNLGRQVIAQVEYEIKYEGFIHRQQKEVEKFRHIEYIRIPEGFDFNEYPRAFQRNHRETQSF